MIGYAILQFGFSAQLSSPDLPRAQLIFSLRTKRSSSSFVPVQRSYEIPSSSPSFTAPTTMNSALSRRNRGRAS
jgi:hypothetical protein